MKDFTKLCADQLRLICANNGLELKPTHAHELKSGLLGYKSNTALLEDKLFPLSNLQQASIITRAPPSFIDERRNTLQGLPSGLPDNNTLTEWFFSGLLAEEWIANKFWPDFEKLAKFLADRHLQQMKMEKIYQYHNSFSESLNVEHKDDCVHLVVKRFSKIINETTLRYGSKYEANITITIRLQRIAAYIGYAEPEISMHIDTITDLKHQYSLLSA